MFTALFGVVLIVFAAVADAKGNGTPTKSVSRFRFQVPGLIATRLAPGIPQLLIIYIMSTKRGFVAGSTMDA